MVTGEKKKRCVGLKKNRVEKNSMWMGGARNAEIFFFSPCTLKS